VSVDALVPGLIAPAVATAGGRLFEEALALREELYRYVAASSRDHHLAEDIVQETLLRAHQHQGRVDHPARWCFTVALNLLRMHFRRRRFLPLRGRSNEAGWDFTRDHAIREQVHDALRRLTVEQRSSLLLQILGGFTCAEIAQMESTTEAAVKQRLYRAREAFRNAYTKEDLP
jgi:RNA polymerase sigma-70 factor (ECF subfamily)